MNQRQNAFKFIVKENRKDMDPEVDFGYFANKDFPPPNVIFNIYNVFTVTEINMKAKEVVLTYGALSMNIANRKSKDRHLTNLEEDLVRNFDYIEDLM